MNRSANVVVDAHRRRQKSTKAKPAVAVSNSTLARHRTFGWNLGIFLSFDEAKVSTAVFVIVSGSDRQAGRNAFGVK